MNKLILSLLIMGLTGISFAQVVHRQSVASEINKVTVFLTGAEVHRNVPVTLKKGINELRFTNISRSTDSRSIQFEMDQPLDLLSITIERDFLMEGERNETIRELKDSIKHYQGKKQEINNFRDAFQTEKNLLNDNRRIGGEHVNTSVEEIRKAADFYRSRIAEVNNELSKLDNELRKLDLHLFRLENQLREQNYRENEKNQVIVVLLETNQPTKINAALHYNVFNCGWAPNYDLVAENIAGKIDLKYKAKVFNNTGNDWNNVEMVLSTGDPKLSASAPLLNPWYLQSQSFSNKERSYEVPAAQSRTDKYSQNNISGFELGEGRLQNQHTGDISGTISRPQVEMRQIEVSELSTEFNIKRKYTIPSDSRPYIVEVTEYELDATFSHVSVPKMDKDAFLLAKITGWEKLDLVPGPSNVYFAQTYVGESFINTRNVEDTLGLSFGRDGKVLVTRKKAEQFSNKRIIGNWKRDTYTYEIIVKNNRNRTVDIKVYDQIPVSQSSDISVSVEDVSGATLDDATGELNWFLQLAPGESKKLVVSFEIKYPKNQKVSVKQYRTISSPSF